ncbi:hypothetical protein D3C77_397090 [compost metagenome]
MQADGIRQQHLPGQVDDDAPGLAVGRRLHRGEGADGFALLKDQRLVGGEFLHGLLAFQAEGLADVFADLGGIVAIGRQQSARRDDQQMSGAIEQFLLGLGGSGLECIEGDVHTGDGDHFAVVQQWHGDAGHQHLLAADGVGVGFEQARAGTVA